MSISTNQRNIGAEKEIQPFEWNNKFRQTVKDKWC